VPGKLSWLSENATLTVSRAHDFLTCTFFRHFFPGIAVPGCFVFGFDEDDPSVFEKTVEPGLTCRFGGLKGITIPAV
jgi:hypothetical protein